VDRLLLICLGGAIGTGARYLTAIVAVEWLGPGFPYGTLLVNLVGSFLIGAVQQLGQEALLIPESARMFLTTGVMGGLTTYSAFSYETTRLLQTGAWPQAGLYVVVTTVCCVALCVAGIGVGRLIANLLT
jgi:fluoride exporter